MGDAVINGTSRMGLTLQGYDQAIALSQTNINQTLKRYSTIDEAAMANFKAVLGPETDPDYTSELLSRQLLSSLMLTRPTRQSTPSSSKQNSKYTYWGVDPSNRRGLPKSLNSQPKVRRWSSLSTSGCNGASVCRPTCRLP